MSLIMFWLGGSYLLDKFMLWWLFGYLFLQCVQRTLDQLVADGKLVEKVYGKQKVYVIDQVHSM